MKYGMRKALTTMAFVNFPLMIGLAVVSKPLVLVLLTEKWAPCIPYLRLLCIVGLPYPLDVINLNVLKARARSDLFFKVEVLKKILIVVSLVITYRWGIIAILYGQIIVSIIGYYLNSYYASQLINYPIQEQLFDFAPYLTISIVMGVILYSFQLYLPSGSFIQLVLQALLGAALYTILSYIFKMPVLLESLEMMKNELKTAQAMP
jgi:O-antigen/teichoic acid export membrane protein